MCHRNKLALLVCVCVCVCPPQCQTEAMHSSRHVPGGGPEERLPRVHHHLPEWGPHLPQLAEVWTGGGCGLRHTPSQTVTVQLEDCVTCSSLSPHHTLRTLLWKLQWASIMSWFLINNQLVKGGVCIMCLLQLVNTTFRLGSSSWAQHTRSIVT